MMNVPSTQKVLGTMGGETFRNEHGQEYWTRMQLANEHELHRATRQLASQGIEPEEGSEAIYQHYLRRVAMDLAVLELVQQAGVKTGKKVEFRHWVNFKEEPAARTFTKWLESQGYKAESLAVGADCEWIFTHVGYLNQQSICRRTVPLVAHSEALGGTYDGWETTLRGLRIGGSWRSVSDRLTS